MNWRNWIIPLVGFIALSFLSFAGETPQPIKEIRAMNKVIHLKATLACEPSEAFAQFTDPRKLVAWLTESAEIEAKVGGKYELFWEPAKREQNSTIGCRVTAIAPNELLAFEWKSPMQFASLANCADPLTHVVVAFAPAGNKTVIHLVHSGWRSSPEWEEARIWQERAWRGALEALEKQVGKK